VSSISASADVLQTVLHTVTDVADERGVTMARKLIFMCFKRPGLDPSGFAAEWSGSRHVAVVERIPGLERYVHNYLAATEQTNAPDGIGELWFETDEALEAALNSPEMGAAVDDATTFLDMGRTYAVPASEATIVG
jgi:uncharacterized protein (TIGR02118 family)